MDICNVMLALGGDHGNTIPKYSVTAAEIAVLREIHGEEAVDDIEVIGDVGRSNREELSRLRTLYGRARREGSDVSHVDGLFPGAAARVYTTVEELELPDILFKAETRAIPEPKPAKQTKSAKAKKAEEPKADAGGNDGVDDMTDEHADQSNEIFG